MLSFCFQLQETLVKYEQTEEIFQKERRGTMDRQQYNSQQLRQVESELNTANNKIRELREEIQKKQNHIMKLEADKVGQSVSKGPILTEQTNKTELGSAGGNVSDYRHMSDYRHVSDCRSRGREFNLGPIPYFRGD